MRRSRIALFFTLTALVAVSNPAPIAAQTQPSYTVQQGDTLYELVGIYSSDQPEMRALVILNPFLAEEGRMFRDKQGRFIVRIRPDEIIEGIERLNLAVEPVPITELSPTPTPLSAAEEQGEALVAETEAGFNWLWLLYALGGLVALYLILRNLLESRRPNLPLLRQFNPALTANPVTAAPPMRRGGILYTDHLSIRRQLVEQAARRHTEVHGFMPSLDDIRIVGDITRGRLYDVWETRDANGRWTPRRYNGEPGYQAMVSVNDGEPGLTTFSQGCANDLRLGARYRGGRFVPDTEVQPIPAEPPEPAPTRSTPFAVPMTARATSEQVLAVIGGLRIMLPAGSIIRTGDDGEITLTVTGPCDIRIGQWAKKTARPKVVRAASGETQ
ncbi:MAG: hypothetical protein G01um101430_175 [Parcubacteria group bacterium Gr01-1014_30]|nr:MAG: hypothetical protein G01um101430_175 [Parcubacteria group bacterium Gr01-1014_30]